MVVSRRRHTREDSGARKVYYHDPVSIEYRGVEIKVKENGEVSFKKYEGEEYDEITVPANAVFKAATLLNTTQKIKWEENVEEEKEKE